MLIETDINELGDKRLNEEEAVIRLRETCINQASGFRIEGGLDLEDVDRTRGPRYQFAEFISKLKRAAPELQVRDGSPGNVALYFPRNLKELEKATIEWDPLSKQDRFFLRHKYVSGLPKQPIQEYSSVEVDNTFSPKREIRGWRTILIALIQQGCCSYKNATKEFGDVGTDKRGWRWKEAMQAYRMIPEIQIPQGELTCQTD
jgi:hypothetical protein